MGTALQSEIRGSSVTLGPHPGTGWESHVSSQRVDGAAAVLVVRDGELPTGAVDCVARATDVIAVVGTNARRGVDEICTQLGAQVLAGMAVLVLESDPNDRFGIARALEPSLVSSPIVVLPASPDGRDLAAYLAAQMGRELVANCTDVSERSAVCVRNGGRAMVSVSLTAPVVCTLQPVLDVDALGSGPGADRLASPTITVVDPSASLSSSSPQPGQQGQQPAEHSMTLRVHPPDAATIDLAEASRIIGIGDGVIDAASEVMALGPRIGCAVGATRVVTDAGVLGHDRQIGTTGVVVRPELYLAFGISGAVQHTAGLGDPAHVISVNLDPHCPMMHMADLAVVADAPGTVAALAALVAQEPDGGAGLDGADVESPSEAAVHG
jgi:electron transfer flavoprotein alpha subunit